MAEKEMEKQWKFLLISDLGNVRSVWSDGSGAVYEGRAQRSEGPACAGRLVASLVAELLAEMKKLPIVA